MWHEPKTEKERESWHLAVDFYYANIKPKIIMQNDKVETEKKPKVEFSKQIHFQNQEFSMHNREFIRHSLTFPQDS